MAPGTNQRRQLIAQLREDGHRIAAHFGLTFRAIEAERSSVRSRYGICYEDGLIKVRLHHARSGKLLKYSGLVATLCHELSHLRHFHHRETFWRFFREVLDWARDERIYRPGSAEEDRVICSPVSPWATGCSRLPMRRNGVPVFLSVTPFECETKEGEPTPWDKRLAELTASRDV